MGPSCTIVLKGDFWGKLNNATFVNVLCPIMLKHFKKQFCDRSWDIRLNYFGQIVPTFFISWKGDFLGEFTNWMLSTYCAPLCYLNVSKKQKNPWNRVDHEIWGVEVLDQIGHKSPIYLQRKFFFFFDWCWLYILCVLHRNTKMIKK